MEYHGKLYGRLGRDFYFDTGKTSEDYDNLVKRVSELEAQLEQKLNIHSVSGKRLTEIIHKAVDETYETVDAYVNEYVDSTHDSMMYDLNSLKDELLKAAGASTKGGENG